MSAPRRTTISRRWLVATVAIVIATDQFTKQYIVGEYLLGESRPLIGDLVWITHVRNSGAAFGILDGLSGVFALAGIIGVVIFGAFVYRHPPPVMGVGAAMITGGAAGNLLDRIVRGFPFGGEVVDFIDLGWWPVFNVADSSIFLGAGLLLASGWLDRE